MGAGWKNQLVFVDRLLARLVHPRHGITHDVLACLFGVDCSTITRAIGDVHPARRARVHDQPRRPAADPGRGRRPPQRRRTGWDHRRHRDPVPPSDLRTTGPGHLRPFTCSAPRPRTPSTLRTSSKRRRPTVGTIPGITHMSDFT
ncbi:transposase family protein [Streptomyces sp. TN58]|uniref:helix-turn-helix domain-containing protein n=1 Tax=Streptomyces sp. TN58 TaxID=234612 RepID=UPI002D218570|nr:transposase family protein [Streptomyces sp. TN58]